jgi:hypothetical protein
MSVFFLPLFPIKQKLAISRFDVHESSRCLLSCNINFAHQAMYAAAAGRILVIQNQHR